ncbi:MAG: FHA domain-containing protein [Phycisphaerae bacterium]
MGDTEHLGPATPLVSPGSPRLHLLVSPNDKDELRIPCRRVVTLLGSQKACKIRLPHSLVSGVHLAIVNDGASIVAVDLVTRYGTLLNGLKLEHEELSDDDALTVGPWEFRVVIEAADHQGHQDLHPLGLEPAPQMVALEHEGTGNVLRPNRALCTVGRRAGCDIVVSDVRVSRVHALLLNYFGHPAVFDLLSHNGTQINGQTVGYRLLEEGDVLTVGETSFVVHLTAASAKRAVQKGPAPGMLRAVSADPDEPEPDLIDIKKTEQAQRWRIADSADKLARGSA